MSHDPEKCVTENQANATGSVAETTTRAEPYPELNANEQGEALNNLRRYFDIAVAVAEETIRAEGSLTHPDSVPTMKERSNEKFKT